MDFGQLGKLIAILGGALLLMGLGLLFLGRLSWFGHLPGDLSWRRGNVSCYAPIVSMLLLSILLTIILNVIARLLNR